MIKCQRCEYFHHDYEEEICPHKNGLTRFYVEDTKNCPYFDPVKEPKSKWTKGKIVDIVSSGGAKKKTIDHIKRIPLEDLKLIILKPLGIEPRGRYSQIWKELPTEWTEVRRTMMYGINWNLIEKWNDTLEG